MPFDAAATCKYLIYSNINHATRHHQTGMARTHTKKIRSILLEVTYLTCLVVQLTLLNRLWQEILLKIFKKLSNEARLIKLQL